MLCYKLFRQPRPKSEWPQEECLIRDDIKRLGRSWIGFRTPIFEKK